MVLVVIFLISLRAHAALWGNYKLYNAKGTALYDYTGNGNTAQVIWNNDDIPILTDRGLYLEDDDSYIKFPNNIYKGYPSSNIMIIVMWLAVKDVGNLIKIESGSNNAYLYWGEQDEKVSLKFNTYDATGSTTSLMFGIINLDEWNLLVLHLKQEAFNTEAYVYESTGTTIIYSYSLTGLQINSPTTTWSINSPSDNEMEVLIYEVWWYDAVVTSIRDTISASIAKPSILTSYMEIDVSKTYNSLDCHDNCEDSCSGDGSICISICESGCRCECYTQEVEGKCQSCYLQYCLTFDPSNGVCSQCITGYYRCNTSPYSCVNNQSSCLVSCGLGYYLNTGLNTCVKCPSNCRICTSDTVCTGCISGYALIPEISTTQCNVCPTGKYADNNSCHACPDLCTACTSYTVCTSCVAYASIGGINNLCYCDSGFTYVTGGSCTGGFGASATMNPDGTIRLTFSGTLNSELTGNVLSFRDGSIVYDSSTFTLTPVISLTSYTITFIKIILSGWNTTRLYFPTTPNTIKSISNQDLATQFIDINIVASSITTSCSSISNCYTCSLSGLNYICDSCRSSLCIYSDPIIRCGPCCDSGYYQDTNACIKCASNCNTCTDGSTCSNCKESYYLLSNNCVTDCGDGYYKETILNYNVCTLCSTGCTTCSNSSTCSSCSESSFLLNNNCVTDCGSGKYKDSINNICSNCILNCEVCQDDISCTICKTGFTYNSANIECESCPELCKDCLNANECISCVDYAILTGKLCTCLSNYQESNGTCIVKVALDAYAEMDRSGEIFLEFTTDLNDELTSSLITFTIKEITYSFPSFNMIPKNNKSYSITLINIPLGDSSKITLNFTNPSSIIANDGSIMVKTSLIIEVPPELHCIKNCKICSIEDRISRCEECESGYYIISYDANDECVSECPPSYYKEENESVHMCKKCKAKCALCDKEDSCNRCEANYYMFETSCVSECPPGYFSDRTDQTCAVCDIQNCSECKYDNESSKVVCTRCVEGTQPENIDNEMNCIEDTGDSVEIKEELNNISSNNNSGSDTYSQADYLAQDPAAEEVASQGATASSSITTIAAAMSFSSTAGLWNLVNTIQLLSVLPLLNVELPIMLFATLTSLRSYNPIPNIVSYMMPEKGPRPFRRASLLGYETGQLLINIGDLVTTLFITLGILPILIVLNKIVPEKCHQTFIGKKVKQYIQGHKWNIFTRFYIECYIELAIAASVQIYTMKDITEFDDFNIMINIIFAVIILVISI